MDFKTPGIYIRDAEVSPPRRVRLDIAGYVGQAERGPLNHPQSLTSWGQFRNIFGGFTGFSYLAYAVFGFFLNGGERGYVVRVAHETAQPATRQLVDADGTPLIQVSGINAGAWGNAIAVTVESRSAGDMMLTELASDATAGQQTVTLRSGAGLTATTEAAPGDFITFLNRLDPLVRETQGIQQIDVTARTVTLNAPLTHDYPSGSRVRGHGFTLTFRYQPGGAVVREEVFENLTLNPDHERYFARVINGDPVETDYVERLRSGLSILVQVADLRRAAGQTGGRPQAVAAQVLENGDDGPQALSTPYYTGYDNGAHFRPVPPDADTAQQRDIAERFFGLATFETVLDVGLLAIPDLALPDFEQYYAENPQIQRPKAGIIFTPPPSTPPHFAQLRLGHRDLLRHCADRGDRFAILDAPPGVRIGKGSDRIEDWPNVFQVLPNSKDGALYYPWIREKAADFESRELLIPPSGHVAGIYARTEQSRGVGQAPANEILQGVIALEVPLSNAEQDLLNPRGVNCLRTFPGRGLRVWGARTLSTDPLWRYVNVRRVYLAIVKHMHLNLQWTVFEPNDQILWAKITASLTLFLRELFLQGALVGNVQDEAFFVKCNDETNTADGMARGEVVAEIGFAPARPAEFILVTIKRTAAALSVRESSR